MEANVGQGGGTGSASGTPTPVELLASRQFASWLAEQRVSLAFTTYQTGKLFLIGLQPDGRLSVFERTFNRCMGLWGDGQTLWMTSLFQVWRFENFLEGGTGIASGTQQASSGAQYDRVYVPTVAYTTGDVDAHDIAVDSSGRVVFVNTLFSCLATLSERHSFVPVWRPPFVSKLAAEDRCHLNGLAMVDGQPRYVTTCSRSDVADGWRDRRTGGGHVLDVPAGQVIADGLSMPHSPRWRLGRLWLLDSGTGFFGYIDPPENTFEPVAFCPGYLRGLAFVGDFAVVGLSKPREKAFTGLSLDENLAARGASAKCGLAVIDLRTGDVAHWLWIEGIVSELYDVVALPGVRRPMAIGLKTDEIRRTISVGQ
jgi:uncharacterized protein (TIGR03032 family)